MSSISLHIDGKESHVQIGTGLLSKLDQFDLQQTVILVDENVFKAHRGKFGEFKCIVVPSGEEFKTLNHSMDIFRKLVDFEADRSSMLIGIGGGLLTDITGFIASTYMRGISFGFISSTLLGQVDASIGGKNGVNLDGYKNMIGNIRQPDFIWCDLDLLDSLPSREISSGFAEVIKYGAIKDAMLFADLENNSQQILQLDKEVLKRVVQRCAEIKVEVVQSDVFELGDRKLLNFGHTLGHAIEKLSGLLHGEAIAIGMVLAAKISVNLGFLKTTELEKLRKLIKDSGLPTETDISPATIFEVLLKDKKRKGSAMSFILLKSLGNAFIHTIELEELKTAINDLY